MRQLSKGILAVGLCAFGAASQADLPKFWNTGEGLTSGQTDVHWTTEKVQGSSVFAQPGNGIVMNSTVFPVAGAYTHQQYQNSKWISFRADGTCQNDDIFRFSQKFYIDPGYGGNMQLPDSADRITFKGLFSSDNASEMYVNGHYVSGLSYYDPIMGYSFEARRTFDASNHLRTGWNEVSFLVGSANTMGANVGPIEEWMGLRVEGKIEMQTVPEPTSMAALAIGAAWLRRRRR